MLRKNMNDSGGIVSIYNALKRCCARSGRYVEKFGKPLYYADTIIVTNGYVAVEVCGFASRYPRFDQLYSDDMRRDAESVRRLHDLFFRSELDIDDKEAFIIDAKYLKQAIAVFSALKCADNIAMGFDSRNYRMMLHAISSLDANISVDAVIQMKRRTI